MDTVYDAKILLVDDNAELRFSTRDLSCSIVYYL